MRISREGCVLLVIALLDLVSTIVLVKQNTAAEGNPVMAYFLAKGIIVFIAAKCVFFGVPLFILEYARRTRPNFARMGARLAIVGYVALYVVVVTPQVKAMAAYQSQLDAAAQPIPGMAAMYEAASNKGH